jgi:hypothetical protein
VLTREEAIAELWRRGSLRHKLFEDQRPIYDFVKGCPERIVVVNIARQFGKSFILCTIADEFARQHPGALIRFVTGSQKALRKIVQPILRELHRDCPDELRPEFNSLDGCYRYPNSAELHLAAANDGHADDSRGQRAHLGVVDEAGFVDDLDYLVSSVLLPQTLTTGGKIVLISTPPITPAHAFYSFWVRASAKGAAIKRTLDDNKHISDGEKRTLIEEMGGPTSTQTRREAFCEFVVDETRAICPEYNEQADAEIAATEPAPPTFEQPTVAMDVGFEDAHHILYGYYDFKRGKRVIQAEDRLVRATTDKIAQAIKDTEERLWGGRGLRKPVRWSDTDLRLIADLTELHGLSFNPTAKDDKEAQVNALRISVKNRGWHIAPSCTGLRQQLQLGVWNKARTEFDRSKEHGHFDAVDAAIYFNRNVDIYSNPYPALPPEVTHFTHRIRDGVLNRGSETGRAFAQAFGKRRA